MAPTWRAAPGSWRPRGAACRRKSKAGRVSSIP
ncbi:hypothetical protein EZ313_21640 [Ramlibacter henchirensis]|uniref:Uncharacterized protein n=1 Tax=Ramlibacter henchirensis TaxID=204072 RepID=A0A4Z0BLP5_9BURK|nr:hypothetical protein EZ313_21640 [Ramlibacter henchirensis]